jgi:hypothetical protein
MSPGHLPSSVLKAMAQLTFDLVLPCAKNVILLVINQPELVDSRFESRVQVFEMTILTQNNRCSIVAMPQDTRQL